MMKILFACLFCAAALVNIISCAANRQTPRRIAKALLMPLLAVTYILFAPVLEVWVLVALGLGWLGDLFLIRPGHPMLRTLGIAAFLLGHVGYLVAIFRHFAVAPALWACIAAPVFFLLVAAVIYRFMLPILPKDMLVTGAIYYLALAALAAVAALALLSGDPGGVPLLIGAVLFMVSDTILCRQFFTVGDPAPKYDFWVMTTYLLAQAALVAAFCV